MKSLPAFCCLIVSSSLFLAPLVEAQTVLENFDSLTLSSSIGGEAVWSVDEGTATISDAQSASGSQSVALGVNSPLSEAVRTVQGSEWGSDDVAWWDVWMLPMADVSGVPVSTIDAGGSMLELLATQVEFRVGDLVSYSGGQDGQGSHPTVATISDGGSTIQLEGNIWKAMPYQYTVTPDTVLSFEVKVDDAGELIAIIIDNNLVHTDPHMFGLAGSQSGAWVTSYSYTGSGYQSFQIPVGQYVTGPINYVGLIADDDANGSADVTFRHVKIHEGYLPSGEQGMFVVNDGGSERFPLPTYFSTTSNAADSWMRLTVRQDFANGVWDLYLDGGSTPIAADISFSGSPTEPTEIRFFGDAVGTVYLDDLQLLTANPLFTDSDNDGMSDAWESSHNLSTSLNDRDLDPDMDTLTNLEEYVGNTAPDNYYNDVAPSLTKVSGDQQTAYPGIWLEEPLVVNAQSSSLDLENAPIDWEHSGSLNALADSHGSTTLTPTLEVRTDANGESAVYVKAPDVLSSFAVSAAADYGSSQVSESFTVNVEPLRFVYDAEDGSPDNDLYNDHSADSEDGNNFYTRTGRHTISSYNSIPIDPSKQYRVSGLFRSAGPATSRLHFGFYNLYKDDAGVMRVISPEYVNRNGVAAEIESYDDSGSNVIIDLTTSPTGWNSGGSSHQWLGYYIGGDTSGLPDLVQRGVPNGNTYDTVTGDIVQLADGVALPTLVIDALANSEVVLVQNHFPGGLNYAGAAGEMVPYQWTEYKNENITGVSWNTLPSNEFWPGSTYARVMILAHHNQTGTEVLEFDNLVFEEVTDYDSDGIPDWWEWRIIEASDVDGLTALADVGASSDFDGDGLTDAQEYAAGNDPLSEDNVTSAGGVYYVNNMSGSDTACNGLSATNGIPSAGDGPFNSLSKAVTTASTDDVIVLYKTRNKYDESAISLAGKDLVLRPVGDVVLR